MLDCPVYQGNSGGPVLETDYEGLTWRAWVIGVVIQSVPYEDIWENKRQGYTDETLSNSGYSIAAPMDGVLALTR
jgi:hypothetical protein